MAEIEIAELAGDGHIANAVEAEIAGDGHVAWLG